MHRMQSFLNRLLRFVFKLVLAAFGLVFAVSLLFAALVMLLVGLVKWAVTGKKPGPVMAFNQFRQFRSGEFKPFAARHDARNQPHGDVVDVEVREVMPKKSDASDGNLPP